MYTTVFEGIKFVEGSSPRARVLKPLRVESAESLPPRS